VPPGDPIASFYVQAINKDAPHPAAARLWEEFLYSDEGQNLFLGGGARPVRAGSMKTSGTLDAAAYHALPPFHGIPVIMTGEQNTVAAKYLADNWATETG
jgi:putative spermidine/putrescine transport system substrate-binding protein